MSQSSNKTEISATEFAYHSHRLQARMFDVLVETFAAEYHAERISRAELARRIDRKPEQITRWLSNPSDMKLSTISRLLLGMEAELDPEVTLIRDRAQPNYAHPLIEKIDESAHIDRSWRVPELVLLDDLPRPPSSASTNMPTSVTVNP